MYFDEAKGNSGLTASLVCSVLYVSGLCSKIDIVASNITLTFIRSLLLFSGFSQEESPELKIPSQLKRLYRIVFIYDWKNTLDTIAYQVGFVCFVSTNSALSFIFTIKGIHVFFSEMVHLIIRLM